MEQLCLVVYIVQSWVWSSVFYGVLPSLRTISPLIRVKILVICSPLYLGHGYEHGAWLILLPDIGQAREDQHPHDHHQHQQAQLFVTREIFCN